MRSPARHPARGDPFPDPPERDRGHVRDHDTVRAERAAEGVHARDLPEILPVHQELHDDARQLSGRPLGQKPPDVREDPSEGAEGHLHHAVVVLLVHGIHGENDLARLAGDQAPRDLAPEQGAVGREIVDQDAAGVEVVEKVEDSGVKERVAAARHPHGAQAAVGQLVHEPLQVRQRDLVLGANVLLVAEVAGDVAPVGDVDLGVDRAARRAPGDDAADDGALLLRVDLRPAV